MATQALVAVTAQTLAKFAHYHPAYTITYDFTEDGYISLVFEVPQEASPFYFGSMQLSGGPDTYDIDFLNPDKGLKALYDGIRDQFPLIDIKPGDLTTLTVVDERVFAHLQGRKIKLERWSFPAPGVFELYLPGPEEVEFIFEITAHAFGLVKLTLTCKNMIEQGGPGISDAVTGTFALTEQSSGSPNPWFELEDITNPTLPPSDEFPTLEPLQEAFRASCAYPNPSDDDFKLVVPFSPDTVYMQAYTYTGELYPLTRISHTLPLGVFTYMEDVDPFTLVQYIFADPVGVNIQSL
ncbi:hypothetical protein FOL46_008466 [Perkinsus olseni]|uniref:Uncharacterized protein n=1 Tax=Perkinsus olseni TaxID=32597 RepID=A0A7J6MMW0_PEROL|nr:hypothetical protein FOL46_008466 [Perkinsus olseni]